MKFYVKSISGQVYECDAEMYFHCINQLKGYEPATEAEFRKQAEMLNKR